MGKKANISSIYRQFEPGLYNRFARGKDLNIFNLEFAKNYYFNLLYTLAVSLPTWEGLPLEVDKSILERILINNGTMVFTYDENLGKYLTLLLAEVTKYDTDGRPLEFSASTMYGNIYYRNLTPEKAVVVYDSITQIPTFATIEFYSGRLANLRLTIDMLVRQLKTPYVMKVPNQNSMTAVDAIMNEVCEYKPAVIIDGMIELESMKVYPLASGVPESLRMARDEFVNTFNEALSQIGIANISQDEFKRERMNLLEVERSGAGSFVLQENRLKPRMLGANRISELFGLDVKVTFNTQQRAIDGDEDTEEDLSEHDENNFNDEGGEK